MQVPGGQEGLGMVTRMVNIPGMMELTGPYLVVFQVRVDRGVGSQAWVRASYEHNSPFLTHFVPSLLSKNTCDEFV